MSTPSPIVPAVAPIVPAVASTEVPERVTSAVTAPVTAPVEASTVPVPSVAPGSEAPAEAAKPKRVDFPKLVEAGGKFFAYDMSNPSKGGHFDVNLMPELPPWPELKASDGSVIPLPWLGHSRLHHFALTRDCFQTDAEYKYYLTWERYERARTARAEYLEAKTGATQDATKQLKKAEKVEAELRSLAATLAGKNIDVNALLAALGQIKAEAAEAVVAST